MIPTAKAIANTTLKTTTATVPPTMAALVVELLVALWEEGRREGERG